MRDNGNGALAIGGSKDFSVTNSIIARNRSSAVAAVKLSSSGVGSFQFNTVVENNSVLAAGIECGRSDLEIKGSIVLRNSRLYGSQFQGCKLRSTVVGGMDSAWGIREEPTFTRVNDVEFALDPRTSTCCIDKIPCEVRRDYFGSARPRGMFCDLGAHEAE